MKFFVKLHDILSISVKQQKIYAKYCQNDFENFSKIWFLPTFHQCDEKWKKVGPILPKALTKVHNILRKYSQPFTFGFKVISSYFVL